MKKLLSLLLAVLMIGACALAESAPADFSQSEGVWHLVQSSPDADENYPAVLEMDGKGGCIARDEAGAVMASGTLVGVDEYGDGTLRYDLSNGNGGYMLGFVFDGPRQLHIGNGDAAIYVKGEPMTVAPQPVSLPEGPVPDGEYPASFEPEAVKEQDGRLVIENVKLYAEDVYDPVDVNMLAVGDTILADGETYVVKSILHDPDGCVEINGGYVEDGVTLVCFENANGYFLMGYDDATAYTPIATVTLPVSTRVTFEDSSDPEKDDPVTVSYPELKAYITGNENAFFVARNTTVTVTNGEITAIKCTYVP